MRPLTLTFNGLRSYVEPQTIDFTGKDFIAIVGDTGSGKSTVLDAICYGLYNRCSWPSGSVSDLVAHGGDGTLSVAFTFSAGNKVWRVERSTSPRGGAPTHKLVSVDTDTIVATGARLVTAHIRRIIGLDYDTFLRAVILPQGRFQELLRMRDTDRTRILKSILGLDQLSTVREHAQTLHSRLAVRLAEYRERRAAFLPNPAMTLTEATRRQQAAQERLDILQAAQDAVAAAVKTAADASARQADLDRARVRLANAIPDQADARYQKMLAAAADISQRRQDIDRQRHDHDLEQQHLQGELDKADLEGTGVAAVATAINTLTLLADQLPQLDVQAKRLTKEAEEIRLSAADLERRRTALSEIGESVVAAQRAVAEATSHLDTAVRVHRVASHTLAGLRQASEVVRQAEQRHSTCVQEIDKLKADAKTATADADEAERALAEREAEQARAVKLHAAAVAAEECVPGDPCPVCARGLPADFVAPTNDTTKTAAAAVRAARKATSQAGSKATAASERVRIADQETLAAAAQHLTEATANLGRATAQARDALGEVDLSAPDDELLRHLSDAIQTAKAAHDETDIAHRASHDRHTRAASELPVLEQAHAQRKSKYDDEMGGHESALVGLHRAARTVPPAFQVDQDLSLLDIGRQRAAAEQRQNDLKELTDRLAATRGKLQQLQAAQRQLDDEQATKVTRPANEMRRQFDTLIDRATDAQTLLNAEPHHQRPTDSSLTQEAAWCATMIRHVTDLVDRCSRGAQDAHLAAIAAGEAAEQARRNCDADDDAHLEQLLRLASTAGHNASRDIARATAHQPQTDELDRRIDAAAPTVAALADLVALLADGKFISSAVRQRQLALLVAASNTLLAITGGRFGFAEDFRIIDTDTAQPRDAETLSGGETFQASLALALAVVELASRASGRVDSLFLDEGFGSLDSGVLQDALNALTAHSTAGRLVTVISHMRSITEITDHVLVVKRSFTGSRAYWPSAEEREQIINDDLGRGLLP